MYYCPCFNIGHLYCSKHTHLKVLDTKATTKLTCGLLAPFYWPCTHMFKNIVPHSPCQLTCSTLKSDLALLKLLPIFCIPYHRITIDIVGPLVRSHGGHQYLLAECMRLNNHCTQSPLMLFCMQWSNCFPEWGYMMRFGWTRVSTWHWDWFISSRNSKASHQSGPHHVTHKWRAFWKGLIRFWRQCPRKL